MRTPQLVTYYKTQRIPYFPPPLEMKTSATKHSLGATAAALATINCSQDNFRKNIHLISLFNRRRDFPKNRLQRSINTDALVNQGKLAKHLFMLNHRVRKSSISTERTPSLKLH